MKPESPSSANVASAAVPKRAAAPRSARALVALAVVLLAAGILAAIGVAVWLARVERARAWQAFQADAGQRQESLSREIQLVLEVLESLRQVPQVGGDSGQFEAVARKGMVFQQQVLGAYGFIQTLPAPWRDLLARDGRTFLEADPGHPGAFREAAARDAYFPLTWQTPPGGLGVPLDYDFGARPEDRLPLVQTARGDYAFALGGGAFDREDGTRYLFAPVYLREGDAPPRAPEGYAVCLFQPGLLLSRLDANAVLPLSFAFGPAGAPAEPDDPAGWCIRFVLPVGNEDWAFTVVPASPLRDSLFFWLPGRPLLAAAAVAAAALFLALFLFYLARQSRRVERLVLRRTRELDAANLRLRDVMAERLSLEERLLRLADDEKARLGRDLHDSLGQKLTGALYLLAAYRRLAEDGIPSLEDDGGAISDTLKDALSQVRRMAKGLAPVELTPDGLPDALRALAAESARLFAPLDVQFVPSDAPAADWMPSTAVAAQLHLVAREAVVNAAKHAHATHVRMGLAPGDAPRTGLLWIEDDGTGLPASPEAQSPAEGGNGLRIMRHRAEVFGGSLALGSAKPHGLRVECRYPVA